MSVHYLAALALQTLVPFASSAEASSAVKVGYSDVANEYASLKYSNGYLRFWDDVHGRVDLRTTKVHEIYSDSKSSKFFKKVKGADGDTWKGLVLFCKKMRDKIENGKDLTNRQLKLVGWCDKGDSIPRSKEMNSRSYWVDQLARTKYKAEDFGFWDKLSERIDERTHKLYDLRQQGYTGTLEEVLGRAKSECQVVRDKFEGKSKDRLTEEDLNVTIPRCISSLRTR
ncbi:hypothetical protein HF1_14090 [Mycoplasma haemofelis str. Langford 1]|uniref:Uncharacterized protein n=1 Tax=Mycoplasma haemofelis (strain Langford 1) TaxID=941640 RepID=E8ZJU6_MYCHL|nr:hypothetical protein [Mycoplasma haemofelis]CBY93417.1 hypothetical protein HF1_14090 [Mycoplasma haemofelis str. Langford 1]